MAVPLADTLGAALDRVGVRHALAPVDVAEALNQEIAALRDQGLLAERLFEAYREYWRFAAPDGMKESRALIAVAWASPPVKVRFQMADGPLDAIVPPTYISTAERSECLALVRSVLEPQGYSADWARVPAKLLAVRTGLAEYGRNNITYVPGLGSYARLGALCTDADLGVTKADARNGEWTAAPHSFMEQCADCGICQRACPTGCIPEDGTVVDASRCLTEANENEGAWPPWVPADSHNCLYGCMLCQKPCPADRMHRDHHIEIVAEFDRDETALILEGLERGTPRGTADEAGES